MPTTLDDQMPVLALVPDVAGQHIELFDEVNALRMAIVQRDGVRKLSDEWEEPGIYLLLRPASTDGTWSCYVGKADRLRERVSCWLKDDWSRCLLVQRDTTYGFDATQAGWLEANLLRQLAASALAEPWNKVRPTAGTMPPYGVHALLACINGIMHTLRLLGYEPAAADDIDTDAPTTRTRYKSKTTLSDLLSVGLLQPGEAVVSVNGLWPATGHIEPNGTIRYNGVSYEAVSAAGMAAKKGSTVNGWEFWAVKRDGQPLQLAQVRAEYDAEYLIVKSR